MPNIFLENFPANMLRSTKQRHSAFFQIFWIITNNLLDAFPDNAGNSAKRNCFIERKCFTELGENFKIYWFLFCFYLFLFIKFFLDAIPISCESRSHSWISGLENLLGKYQKWRQICLWVGNWKLFILCQFWLDLFLRFWCHQI